MRVVPESSNRSDWPRLVAQASNSAQNDIKTLQDAKQDKDATLTALAALDAVAGLVEQTGADTFAKRVIGVVDALSVPTRGDGDARYVMQDVGPVWSAATGTAGRGAYASYAGQTVSNPPTQAQMQALDNAVKALSQAVVAMITDLRANGCLT